MLCVCTCVQQHVACHAAQTACSADGTPRQQNGVPQSRNPKPNQPALLFNEQQHTFSWQLSGSLSVSQGWNTFRMLPFFAVYRRRGERSKRGQAPCKHPQAGRSNAGSPQKPGNVSTQAMCAAAAAAAEDDGCGAPHGGAAERWPTRASKFSRRPIREQNSVLRYVTHTHSRRVSQPASQPAASSEKHLK
jgi:hypothetical protein